MAPFNHNSSALLDPLSDSERWSNIIPASWLEELRLPLFDVSVAAGFPVPLDNDERPREVDLLRMLCPNPEASYLIRVEGSSMTGAGIYPGDIVIVDKSQREPTAGQVAMCEFRGEYTLKYVERRGNEMFLVPANPKYAEMKVEEGDDFYVWGTVTYVIHKPNH